MKKIVGVCLLSMLMAFNVNAKENNVSGSNKVDVKVLALNDQEDILKVSTMNVGNVKYELKMTKQDIAGDRFEVKADIYKKEKDNWILKSENLLYSLNNSIVSFAQTTQTSVVGGYSKDPQSNQDVVTVKTVEYGNFVALGLKSEGSSLKLIYNIRLDDLADSKPLSVNDGVKLDLLNKEGTTLEGVVSMDFNKDLVLSNDNFTKVIISVNKVPEKKNK